MRTEGIYTIMITLAIGVAFFYLAQQNYIDLQRLPGLQPGRMPPVVLGVDLREPVPFYYLALVCALAGYFFVKYLLRAPFGVALQGMRDNPRRMNALGFDVDGAPRRRLCGGRRAGRGRRRADGLVQRPHLAGHGGHRRDDQHPRSSPCSAACGTRSAPFIGAIVFVLLQNFAIDLIDARALQPRDRRACSSSIVLFSPDGLLGLWGTSVPALAGGVHRLKGWGVGSTRREPARMPTAARADR